MVGPSGRFSNFRRIEKHRRCVKRVYLTIEMFERSTARLDIFYGRPTSRMPGNATPATYMIDGKQYVVIATSGVRDLKGYAERGIGRVGVTVTSFQKE